MCWTLDLCWFVCHKLSRSLVKYKLLIWNAASCTDTSMFVVRTQSRCGGRLPVFVSPEKSKWHKSMCYGNVTDQWCPVYLSSPDSMDNIFSQGGAEQFLQVFERILGREAPLFVWRLAGTKPHVRPVGTKVEIHHSHDGDMYELLSHCTVGAGKESREWPNVEFHVLLDCMFSSGVERQPSLI